MKRCKTCNKKLLVNEDKYCKTCKEFHDYKYSANERKQVRKEL